MNDKSVTIRRARREDVPAMIAMLIVSPLALLLRKPRPGD